MHRYFDFAGKKTSYRQETVAGITTFLTMACIIIVNPAMLESIGILKGASITATIVTAVFGTLVMDITELIPAFLTIVLISFTYNIGVGMTAGLLIHPVPKLVTGRVKEVPPPLWLLAAMSPGFYLVYPYR